MMTRTISIRVPDELFDWLKRGAQEDRRHLGDYARLVLADAMDRAVGEQAERQAA
jgi:hypothetical protein